MSAACSEPTASMTARTSSIRSSSVGAPTLRSERPMPRLSNVISREKLGQPSVERRPDVVLPLDLEVADQAGDPHDVERTRADHPIRDVDIAGPGCT